MRTLAQLQQAFKSGKEQLHDDEYLGKNWLPYCKKCKTPRWYSTDDKKFAVRTMCKCQSEAIKHEQEIDERRKCVKDFQNMHELSSLGERYYNAKFSTAIITDNNRDAFIKAKNYVKNIEYVIRNNIGLYVYGDNSTGKTFLTACICNELVWRRQKCIYTSFATIRNAISASYSSRSKSSNEKKLLEMLTSYDFVFIDDFGKEFLGREFRQDVSKWAEEKLFEVLNGRYNAMKPTIFSSNYSIGELMSVLGLDKAIVERVNEMATRVIKLNGDDFRGEICKQKNDIAKSLGI